MQQGGVSLYLYLSRYPSLTHSLLSPLSLCLTGMAPWPNATGCHCQMWKPASINYLEAHPRALWRTSQERASNDNNNKTRKTDNGQLENRQLAAGNGQRATGNWRLATGEATVHYAITAWMRHSWPSFQSQAITVPQRKRQLTTRPRRKVKRRRRTPTNGFSSEIEEKAKRRRH